MQRQRRLPGDRCKTSLRPRTKGKPIPYDEDAGIVRDGQPLVGVGGPRVGTSDPRDQMSSFVGYEWLHRAGIIHDKGLTCRMVQNAL